ncbi:uncharacterized protein LOC128719773 [Anopheles marshallii]|uniref:uncharacterized protein LOC128719773 n=1 Tax=Anopheles marshallii TaxID=1521116 RepID=UPI00237B0161|nr:uncharacterized protein LOC128719773 [Anopheles marshallii]
MIPHRTVRRRAAVATSCSQRGVLKCKRSMTFGAAVLLLAAMALMCLINVTVAEAVDKMADTPSSEEATVDGEQFMPQALSLTTLLSEDPTAEALQPGHTDASLQPLSEHNPSPSSPDVPGADGRRRRRLGRKRKRRPLQDDYWPPAVPEDNDTESNGFSPTAASGRVSDRKRLAYAASRWEEPAQRVALARPATRSNANHHQRPGDWMHNPYTDAINVEQPPATVRRLPGGQSTSSSAPAGNLSPIDPNRSRRIAGGRPTEQPPTNGKAYRKPYSQARRTEEPSSPGDAGGSSEAGKVPVSATDLKALLKQSDGLSLSEILQQRNISLQDLIKGKQMALAALTQSPLDATTTMTTMGDESSTTLSPTLSSVRFRVHDDSVTGRPEASGDTGTATPPTTSTVIPANDLLTTSGFNGHLPSAVEDESNNAVGDDIGHGVGNIFPTVEIKQLALNPVLPMHKDEQRIRPIKGVASRIRPDLSNTHIRTEPGQVAQRVRLPAATTTTGSPTVGPTNPSLLLMTSTTRERWTPSAALAGQRQKFQTTGKQFHTGRYGPGTTLPSGFSSTASESDSSPLALTTTLVGTTTEPPSAKKLVRVKLSSAEATSILPEAEAMVELSPERQLHQHLLRVPKLKPRIAIKPRLTNVVPPTLPAEAPSTTVPPSSPPTRAAEKDRFNLSDVELGDDSTGEGSVTTSTASSKQGRQQRLNDDLEDSEEPGLNIIEKFTSFADAAMPATQEERDSEQAAVADLIGRISEHTQRSFTDSLEDLYRDVTESNPSLFNDLSPIASADDRRELLELMEDRRIGSRLAKVLSQRNMTLEQLLEHRRRGSSQLHLAEIANGKVKPIDDKIDIVTAFEHFPRFNIGNLRSIRPDDIKLDSQGFSYFTSIINIRPSDEAYKEARALQDRHRSRRPASPGNHRGDTHFLVKGGSKDRLLVPSKMSAGMEHAYGSNSENYDHQEDHRNEVGDLLDLELSGHGFQHHRSASVTIESTSMPVGVRSAIVASSAIVGVSLVIFIAIFVACRLRQRRRQKLNYTENFNMAKGRLPILHGCDQETVRKSCTPSVSGRSSSLGEQVVYTTHRALAGTSGSTAGNNGATTTAATSTTTSRQRAMMDPNSVEVQDYLWDRKPFQ